MTSAVRPSMSRCVYVTTPLLPVTVLYRELAPYWS